MSQSKGFKEEFAKFFESPDRVKFRELLKNNTGEQNHLDFKESWLENEKLAKHILGFANSKGGILVFGVAENADKSLTSKGLAELKDKTVAYQGVKSFLPDTLKFEIHDFVYTESEYDAIKGKKFQVLIVEDLPQYLPFLSMREGVEIKKNKVYYRGTVNTEEATHDQLQEIVNRRIETQYSSRTEDDFKQHLVQLKELYGVIPKYYTTMPWFQMDLSHIFAHKKNPQYPEEDFEEFIVKMIKKKKEMIQRMVTGV